MKTGDLLGYRVRKKESRSANFTFIYYNYEYYIRNCCFNSTFMDPFLQPDVPAPAKVLSLIRLHHGVDLSTVAEIPHSPEMSNQRLPKVWASGARLNHLHARRRRIALEDIPESAFPVVLELASGTNFVILKEKIEEEGVDAFLVQFPDSRESTVRAERIRELYDGVCVFLSPKYSPQSGGTNGGLWRRIVSHFSAKSSRTGVRASLLANLFVLAMALSLVVSHRLAFSSVREHSLVIPSTGVFMAATMLIGVLIFGRRSRSVSLSSALADLLFVPLVGLAAWLFAGWSAIPFLWIAVVISAVPFLSRRLGGIPSRMQMARIAILGITFAIGAGASFALANLQLLNPALMVGGIVLGTLLVDLLISSNTLSQELLLARLG